MGTAPTRVDQLAELIAMCPRTANRPLLRITSRQRGRSPRFPLPGNSAGHRGESPGQSAGRRRRTRPPASRPLRYWAHSTAAAERFTREPDHWVWPSPSKPVWWPVFGRLTASQTHTLRTGSQSRALEAIERSETGSVSRERSDPLTVRPEGVGGGRPLMMARAQRGPPGGAQRRPAECNEVQ